MRRVLPAIIVLLCLIAASLATANQGPRRVALVIGNSEYSSLTPLANPVIDARRFAQLFQKHGFIVMTCRNGAAWDCNNLTRDQIMDAFERLEVELRTKTDLALVYYAGHGMSGSTGAVLAGTDAEASCEEQYLKRTYKIDMAFDAIKSAHQKIVIVDACRNDPLKSCTDQRGALLVSFEKMAPPQQDRMLFVSSTSLDRTASDGDAGKHSPFARALIDTLEANVNRPIPEVIALANKQVGEFTKEKREQIPAVSGGLGLPDVCLASPCVPGTMASPLDRKLIDETLEQD